PSDYQTKFCDQLVKHCAQGFSFESFAHRIGVSERTLRNWRDSYPEFAEAYDRAKTAALFFFEERLIHAISGSKKSSKQSAAILIFTLKTRFSAIYGQNFVTPPQEPVDVTPGFEFRGRRVTIAELRGQDLIDVEEHLNQKIKELDDRIARIKTPNPLMKDRRSLITGKNS
ncbi:MAG: helix-turn-helix domain containing protein, partial [Bdellovibrionaceae bacterium]|nr:helix-turn-helix domain containing protein [Pseudobdellovibrionaceae bacterium]